MALIMQDWQAQELAEGIVQASNERLEKEKDPKLRQEIIERREKFQNLLDEWKHESD